MSQKRSTTPIVKANVNAGDKPIRIVLAARPHARQHAGDILQEQKRSNSTKRCFPDRATHRFSPERGAVVRAGFTAPLALSFGGAAPEFLAL
jgi:hypothetical protein